MIYTLYIHLIGFCSFECSFVLFDVISFNIFTVKLETIISWYSFKNMAVNKLIVDFEKVISLHIIFILFKKKPSKIEWKYLGARSNLLTFTRVLEIGPENHLLGEGEDAESSTFERRVEVVAGIGDELLTLVDPQSNQTDPRPVDQSPSVRCVLLPADLARVLPQQFYLLDRLQIIMKLYQLVWNIKQFLEFILRILKFNK